MAGMNYALRYLLSGTKAIELNSAICTFFMVKPFYCFSLLPVRIALRMSKLACVITVLQTVTCSLVIFLSLSPALLP